MSTHLRTRGIATPLVLGLILALAAVAGAAYYAAQQRSTSEPAESPNVTEKEEVGTERTDDDVMDKEIVDTPEGSFVGSGEVLAGSTTPFIDFTQGDYEKALREDRTILLYFSANWCPICRVELIRTYAAFDELEFPNVVGFQVSYNDNETDDFDENLARQFGIAYQHTKVILKGGQQVLKNGQTWSKDRYIEEITKVAQ